MTEYEGGAEFRPGAWRSEEPGDDLTRLCERMSQMAEDEWPEEVRSIIILDTEKRGALHLHGFEDTPDAVAMIVFQLKMLMQSEGRDIAIVPVNLGKS
jgi:hypothetical protein